MLNFNSLMIGSSDSKALADFYSTVLDKKPDMDEEGGWFAFSIGSGSIAIGPHSEISGTNKEPGRLMLNFESDDPRAEFDRVKATGATVVKEPYIAGDERGEMIMSTFSDPDGNYFQICSKWEE